MLPILHVTKRFQSIRHKLKPGMLTRFVLYRLSDIGIVITPYYWIQEGLDEADPAIRCLDQSTFQFDFLGKDEIRKFVGIPGRDWCTEDMLMGRLEEGKKCFGAKYGDEVAAFTWFDFDESNYPHHSLTLQPHEVYLHDMFTLARFRGMNLAPQLRRQAYLALREQGYTHFYSVSEALNTPAVRFKLKLKAKKRQLVLAVNLFGKFRWRKVLKTYD